MLHATRRIDACRHALVARAASHAVEPFRIDRNHPHTAGFRQPDQVAHARIVALRLQVDFQHAVGILADTRGHGVKAVNQAQISHASSCPPWISLEPVSSLSPIPHRYAFPPLQKGGRGGFLRAARRKDRKSTRLNSSHSSISYAVFCLKKTNI